MKSRPITILGTILLLVGPACGNDDPGIPALLKEAVEAASNDDSPRAIGLVERALEAAPDNRDALYLLAILASTQAGEVKGVGEKVALYRKSASAFDRIKAKYPTLSTRESAFADRARLDGARALALEGKPAPALAEVVAMVGAGFDDFEAIENDPDLAAVRKLPAFAPEFAKAVKAGVARELAETKSFPFDFKLNDLDDKPVTLADYKGKVTIVDIWGTWCPPCRAEIPTFVDLYKAYKPKGLEIVGINCNETGSPDEVRATIRDFARAQKMEYRCLVNDDKTEAQVPNFQGYPTTLFLDRAGKVRLRVVGAASRVRLEAVITALLAEPARP